MIWNFPGLDGNAGPIRTGVFTLQACIQVHLKPPSGRRRHNLPHMSAHWVVLPLVNKSIGRLVPIGSIHSNVPLPSSCVIESNKAVCVTGKFVVIIFQWRASWITLIKFDITWQPFMRMIVGAEYKKNCVCSCVIFILYTSEMKLSWRVFQETWGNWLIIAGVIPPEAVNQIDLIS